ncbi:MAG TPA: TAXI family TRAP transporter solute-binding subunit [Stellaceae bacterium]|nr:TAXI family TRAP transporter solute-binding subunit [Stellaceae bacterium]
MRQIAFIASLLRRALRPALALAAVVALAVPLALAVEDIRFFRIGTAATTGTYFQIGGVLASAISKPPGTRDCDHGGGCGVAGLVAVAQATQGSIENLLAIDAGQLESGFAQSDIAHWAYAGDGPAPSSHCRAPQANAPGHDAGLQLLKSRGPMPNLRMIAALFPEDFQIVVRAESDIQSLKDLKGKRIGLGEPGSGTIADARLVLEAAGIGECDVKPQYMRLARAAEALTSGDLDALVIVAGVPVPAIAEIASLVPVRLIPIDGAVLNKLMGRPPFYRANTIAGGTYPGIDAPVPSVSVTALWVVGAGVADDLVYAITRALWQDTTRRLLDFSHPAGRRIRIATALSDASVPLHPGAARYYAELGMELPPAR